MLGFRSFRVAVFFWLQVLFYFAHKGYGAKFARKNALRQRSIAFKRRYLSKSAFLYNTKNDRLQELPHGVPEETKPISVAQLEKMRQSSDMLANTFETLLEDTLMLSKFERVTQLEAPVAWSFGGNQLGFEEYKPMGRSRSLYQPKVDSLLHFHVIDSNSGKKMTYVLSEQHDKPPIPEWIARVVDLEFYATRVVFVLGPFVSRTAVPLQWFSFGGDMNASPNETVGKKTMKRHVPWTNTVNAADEESRDKLNTAHHQRLSLEFLRYTCVPQTFYETQIRQGKTAAVLYSLKSAIVRSENQFPKWYFWLNTERSTLYLRLVNEKETKFQDILVSDSESTLAKFVPVPIATLLEEQKRRSGSKFTPIERLQLSTHCELCEVRETAYFKVLLARLLLQAQAAEPGKSIGFPIWRGTRLAKKRVRALFKLVNGKAPCQQFYKSATSLSEQGVKRVAVSAAYVSLTTVDGKRLYAIGFCGFDQYLCGFDECAVPVENEPLPEFVGAERVRFSRPTWLVVKPSSATQRASSLVSGPTQLTLVVENEQPATLAEG